MESVERLQQKLAKLKEQLVKVEPVTIAGLDEPVYVRRFDVDSRSKFEMSIASNKRGEGLNRVAFRTHLIYYTMSDEKGNLLYSGKPISEVGSLPADILEPFFEASLKINGLGKEEIEDKEKNS
jgi:hypothetical protein